MEHHYPYPHLFSPIVVNGRRIKNRVVASAQAAPHCVIPGPDGLDQASEYQAQYMGLLARGGEGIVNTGHLGVEPRYQLGALRYRFDFYSDRLHLYQLPMLHLMCDNVHTYGALASLELNHGGDMSTPLEGNRLLGPNREERENGLVVEPMDRAEMERVAEYFADAAEVAKRGGFDMINIHAAHNWLLGKFLSPIYNRREDEFGGTPENRARFVAMVLRAIRERVGSEMLLSLRYSVAELVAGGATLEESIRSIRVLAPYVDIIHCSAGKVDNLQASNFLFPSVFVSHGVNAYLAKAVKEAFPDKAVETVGGINDPALADALVAEGQCDLVAMARSFIADNDWAQKAHDGAAEDIRPCIRCLRCLNESVNFAGHRACTVNPARVLFQTLPESTLPRRQKKVVVVGGGPAGLQAANELALRGHRVVLLEKSGKLGGRLSFADHVEFKQDLRRYRDYLIRQVTKRENIRVYLNTEATVHRIESENPDALVVAVGAPDYYPPIPGAIPENVIHGSEVFERQEEVGRRVVIIGGGTVGCEAAIQLQRPDRDLTVVEMGEELMAADREDYPDQRDITLFYVNHAWDPAAKSTVETPEEPNVHLYTKTRCVAIRPDGAEVVGEDGVRVFLPADTVILATGLRPDRDALAQYEGLAHDVLFLGDCKKPGNIYHTSTDGYYAAQQV